MAPDVSWDPGRPGTSLAAVKPHQHPIGQRAQSLRVRLQGLVGATPVLRPFAADAAQSQR